MARKKLIAGNWKMNNSNKEALELVNQLKDLVKDVKDRDIMIAPTFTCLSDVNNAIKGSNIKLGAQNLYFAEKGADYGINTERIAIAGDSAGGNMAAGAVIRAAKEGINNICFQALLYPVTNANMDSDSYMQFKDGPWLSKKAMEWFFDAYLPDKDYKNDIYVSPLKTEISDLKNLPPALVIVAENDVLRDEGEAYARKLIEAGVDTVCVRINNTCNDFILLNALRESMASKAAYKLLCRFLKHKLH